MRIGRLFFIAISAIVNGATPENKLSIEPNFGQSGSEICDLARLAHNVVFFLDHVIVFCQDSKVGLELLASNRDAVFEPLEPQTGTISYFVGRDRSRWAQDVPSYGRLKHRGVYRGIDTEYHGSTGKLEYEFVVAPYADPTLL